MFGVSLGAAGAGMGNPILALQQAIRTRGKSVAAAAQQPSVKRDVAAFRAAVASAPDAKALLANPAARRVLLTANGLEQQADSKALVQQALLSDPGKPGSLVNRLPNRRWAAMAQTFDFANKGLDVLRDPAVLDRVADAYAEIAWRKSLDVTTPGLSKAMDFRERAARATSAAQILGDPVLRDVVTTALGIPVQIAFQPLDTQERAINARLDVRKLQDSKFVEQFTRRYLIAVSSNGTQAASLFV